MITSALASAIRTLAKVSGAPRGAKSFELAGSLGLAPWQIDKARRQLSNWSPAAIAHAVQEVATADAAVKGAAVDPIYALETAISAIATGRKKASLSRS
jgi:DNA polymerase-3 subunit delta